MLADLLVVHCLECVVVGGLMEVGLYVLITSAVFPKGIVFSRKATISEQVSM